jgi:hypothetical protein
MSEYQYHEWQTVDRVLTPAEQAAVNNLSSHIDVSSSRAVVTYHWSNFRHEPRQVLLQYFDGYFYVANWGSLRLMFRFPKGLLDEADIVPYCVDRYISFETVGQYQVLDLDFNPEEGESWMEAEAGLSLFIQLRADLADGDFRLLYLAWLKAMTFEGGVDMDGEDDPDDLAYDREPPVPPGLKKLSPPLQNFVNAFALDTFLVRAAAEASPDPRGDPAVNYRELLGQLAPAERDEFLIRLAEGEAGVGLALRKRLSILAPRAALPTATPRTLQQLSQRARQLEIAEHARQAEAARRKHVAEMKALAAREPQTWEHVNDLLANGRKIASVYDEATQTLEKLQQLAEFQNRRDDFRAKVRQLAERYRARPSLIERWGKRGWI